MNQMARHIWSVLCNRASIDSTTNTLSLFEVLEEVQAKVSIPSGSAPPTDLTIPLTVTLASLWERSEMDVAETSESFEVRLKDPNGKELARNEQVFSLDGAKKRMRILLTTQLNVRMSGRFEFRVMERSKAGKWREVASLPLDVSINVEEIKSPPKPS